jgi:CubicO group peptidase (beta-lactamase class C family)
MLFADGATDTVAYAIAKPLVHPPGKHWQYSSATTQILADIVARTIAPNAPPSERRELTAAWFQREFWQPLGITSAEFDFDQAGTFLGCCLLHMTARDWARLGEALQARKPAMTEAWFATMTTPSRAANDNHYGGQLWLNTGPAPNQPPILFHPRGGTDTIAAVGHHGQFVIAVPAKRAVVVRLGLAVARERGPLRERLGDLIEAIPAP